ncbi:unnamed protein product [Rotaria sordida]|uniref:Uncharacterized protein n=1 Tax=Rotaria sordida TaxID=392033 RepID=A0A819FQK5_9BILA|nr:unnamed protein product [Rotaria sordida]
MYLCFISIDSTHIRYSCERLCRQYTGRVIQHFSPKEKIDLEIIKDLHILVDKSLREFSNNNSRLSNKLISYRSDMMIDHLKKFFFFIDKHGS